MITAENQKSILPVTKAANFQGFSIAGLWKRFVRETDSKYSYPTFHGVTSGRIRVEGMEAWLIKEGFEVTLKEAQDMQNKKNRGNETLLLKQRRVSKVEFRIKQVGKRKAASAWRKMIFKRYVKQHAERIWKLASLHVRL